MYAAEETLVGTPSWSWISQFASGRRITFEHELRYHTIQEYGLQLENKEIVQPPFEVPNPFGKVVSATLKVTACVKWATIRPPAPGRSRRQSGTLYDNHQKPATSRFLAEFWPDDPERTYNDNGELEDLCVLCAVSRVYADTWVEGNTKITALGVIPIENHPGKYRRVGLILFGYYSNDWFGYQEPTSDAQMPDDQSRLPGRWQLADGASMATIELV